MKSAFIAIAASALASVASAQVLSFGYPIGASVWDLSKPNSLYVQWTNDCKSLNKTTFDINLNMQRPDGVQDKVPGVTAPIGTLDCKSKGRSTVTIPDTVASGSLYSIYVSHGDDGQSYSALFTINNPKVPSTPASTSKAATTTGGASATPTKANPTTAAATKPSSSPTPSDKPSSAGALKVGSTAALVIVAAAGLML